MVALAAGFSVPVVSGTGAFAGAHGTVTVSAGDTPQRSLNVYRPTYSD